MEKDDFKHSLSFGEDVFGGPRWRDLVSSKDADQYVKSDTVPLMLHPAGRPVKRNFVHVSDLVDCMMLALNHPGAQQQTFNNCDSRRARMSLAWCSYLAVEQTETNSKRLPLN